MSRIELLIGALLALTVGIVLVFGGAPEQGSSLDTRPSTLRSEPDGSKALYDVLVRLGVPTERRRQPLFDVNRNPSHRPAVLAVLDPLLSLEAAELEQVARFVHAGGAVVAAGSGGGITRCVGWVTANAARLLRVDSFPVQPPAPGLDLPPVVDYLRRPGVAGETDARRRMRGGDIEIDQCDTLTPIARDTLLRLRNGRPAALRLRYRGGGSVALVADVGYFRNRTWRTTDVPAFIAPLLVPSPRRPGPVVWDEYHQGFGEEGSVTGVLVAWMWSTPIGWALLQLAAVLLVALGVAAVRFGPARSVIERRRRSPLEHLEALAAGLEGAGGVDTAVSLTVSGLRRRLGRVGVLPAGAERAWLAALELALPTPRGRNAVRRLQRTINQPGGPERALAAAQAVEDVWEELRPRTTRAGF
jgi:hypothetical protein